MNVQKIIGEKPIKTIETISAQETLSAAVAILGEKKIGALIVSDGKDGVAGIFRSAISCAALRLKALPAFLPLLPRP